MVAAVAGSREQKLNANSSQGDKGGFSSDTSLYIQKFTSLNNEIANLRGKAAEAGQSPQTTNPGGTQSSEEKEITKQLNVQDGGNKFASVIQTAKAREFWDTQLEDIKKQLTYVSGQLGIDSTGSPPLTSGNENKSIAPGNNVQEVQPGSGSETNTLTANPQGGQQPASAASGNGEDDSMRSGKNIEMDLGTLDKAMNSLPGGVDKYNGTFFGVASQGEGSNVIGQKDMDCGACAYLNATNQANPQKGYGQISSTKQQMGSRNPNAGVYPEQMARFLGQTPERGIGNLKNTLASGKNAIVAVNPQAYSNSPGKSSHWISIEAKDYDPVKNTIKIEDSLSDPKNPESPNSPNSPSSPNSPGYQDPEYSTDKNVDNPDPVTGDDIKPEDGNLYDPARRSNTYDLDKQAIRKKEEDMYQRQEAQSP